MDCNVPPTAHGYVRTNTLFKSKESLWILMSHQMQLFQDKCTIQVIRKFMDCNVPPTAVISGQISTIKVPRKFMDFNVPPTSYFRINKHYLSHKKVYTL